MMVLNTAPVIGCRSGWWHRSSGNVLLLTKGCSQPTKSLLHQLGCSVHNYIKKGNIAHILHTFFWSTYHLSLILIVLLFQIATGPYCYLIFCAICLGVAVYSIFVIPETKNKTFMEISQMFASRNNILEEELVTTDHLKMSLMNGYGALEQQDLH